METELPGRPPRPGFVAVNKITLTNNGTSEEVSTLIYQPVLSERNKHFSLGPPQIKVDNSRRCEQTERRANNWPDAIFPDVYRKFNKP
jgi:hypothetical protein